MRVTAEISLYPLRKAELMPSIGKFVSVLREKGLDVTVGALSSTVVGESAALFAAVSDAYQEACLEGTAVLVVKVANVDPVFSG